MTLKSLNKATRATIVNSVLKHAFADKFLKQALDRQALAYEVFDACVDTTVAATLREPWVTRDKTMFTIVDGPDVYVLEITGKCQNWDDGFFRNMGHNSWCSDTPKAERKIVLPNGGGGWNSTGPKFAVDSFDMFAGKYRALELASTDLQRVVLARRREIEAMVGHGSSVNKLLERWPEVQPFLPNYEEPNTNVPATRDLNTALGLPA